MRWEIIKKSWALARASFPDAKCLHVSFPARFKAHGECKVVDLGSEGTLLGRISYAAMVAGDEPVITLRLGDRVASVKPPRLRGASFPVRMEAVSATGPTVGPSIEADPNGAEALSILAFSKENGIQGDVSPESISSWLSGMGISASMQDDVCLLIAARLEDGVAGVAGAFNYKEAKAEREVRRRTSFPKRVHVMISPGAFLPADVLEVKTVRKNGKKTEWWRVRIDGKTDNIWVSEEWVKPIMAGSVQASKKVLASTEPRPDGLTRARFENLRRMDLVWLPKPVGSGMRPLWVSNQIDKTLYDPDSGEYVFCGPNHPEIQPMVGKLRRVFISDEPVGAEFWIGPSDITDLPTFNGPFFISEKTFNNHGELVLRYSDPAEPGVEHTLPRSEYSCCYVNSSNAMKFETKITGDVQKFHEISKTMKPGMNLKYKQESDPLFSVGKFEGFDEVPSPANPSVMKKKIRIRTPNSGVIKVDPTDPRNKIDVWIVRLPHELSMDEYVQHGEFWAECSDPVLDSLSKDKNGKHRVMVVKLRGNVATVKVIKGKVPWLVDVPKDTLKPVDENFESPEWAAAHTHGHRFSPGDVVTDVKSGKPYVVAAEQTAGSKYVALTTPGGMEVASLPASELEFGGRLNQAGRVVTVSPMSSARLKATPQKPKSPAPARAPEPPSQEV